MPDVTGRILEAAQGNPLFIEQVIAHLVDQRIVDATAAGDREEVTIPGSLTALLEARLDSLSDLQRAVLQRGSIEGQVFHRGAVSTLLPIDLRGEVASSFGPLMQKEFISPGEAELAGEDAFRFRHLLIKDAAYRALPKETRAELHERLADWLEDVAGPRLPELEEIVAYHLETAFRYREELGSADAASALAHRAAARFAAAGERASKRGDVGAATSLLGRAVELGDPGHHDRVRVLLKLANVAELAGQTDLARRLGARSTRRCPPRRIVHCAPPSWWSDWTQTFYEMPVSIGPRPSVRRPMWPSRSSNAPATSMDLPPHSSCEGTPIGSTAGYRRQSPPGNSRPHGRAGQAMHRSKLKRSVGSESPATFGGTPADDAVPQLQVSLDPSGRCGHSGRHSGRSSFDEPGDPGRRPRSERGCGSSQGAVARAWPPRLPRPLRELRPMRGSRDVVRIRMPNRSHGGKA